MPLPAGAPSPGPRPISGLDSRLSRRAVALCAANVRWHIVALLFVVSFVAYVLRTNMSVAGERMMADLGLTKVQLGWVLAAFAWGYAMFQIPGGIFGDRLGGRRALTLIVVAWGGLNLLVGLLPHGAV